MSSKFKKTKAALIPLEKHEKRLQEADDSDDVLAIIADIENAELGLMRAFADDTSDINRPDSFPARPSNYLLQFIKRMAKEND